MPTRFDPETLDVLRRTKYLRVRAGSAHRFTGIWTVVVQHRLFVRSWTLKPGGWNDAFRRDPLGAILVNDREVPVRASRPRGERILAAIDDAYRAKYTTKANVPYVAGLCEGERRASTTELTPNAAG